MRRDRIESLLPEVFQQTAEYPGPLSALLDVMSDMHAPAESVLEEYDRWFSAHRTTDPFVPLLASWVDLGPILPRPGPAGAEPAAFAGGVERLREVVAAAAYLARWRGTALGLTLFLETATGIAGFAVDDRVTGPDGRHRPFHVRVTGPVAARPFEQLVRQIIEFQKPAFATYELLIDEPGETAVSASMVQP